MSLLSVQLSNFRWLSLSLAALFDLTLKSKFTFQCDVDTSESNMYTNVGVDVPGLPGLVFSPDIFQAGDLPLVAEVSDC